MAATSVTSRSQGDLSQQRNTRKSVLTSDSSHSWVRSLNQRASLRQSGSQEDAPVGNCEGLKSILFAPISLLLFCFPVGVWSAYSWHNDAVTFWMMFGAMIPLAKILGDATEELATSLKNDMLSGLLNASFGNAVEMIMTVAFLKSHKYTVVKMTLMGSVLSNMLLVLGMSFFCGGLVKSKSKRDKNNPRDEPLLTILEKEQKYSTIGALVNTSMLLMACLAFALITVYNYTIKGTESGDGATLSISREAAVVIVLSYAAFIIFQLVTHKDTMCELDEEDEEDDDGETEESAISASCAIGLLFVSTAIVAFSSELLTDSLESALASSNLTKAFVSVILIPIVGNACEHAAAIRFAMHDKPGLSVGIAVGSAVQVAIFVAPFAVLMGWALGSSPTGENMDLNFGALDVTVLTMSVVVVLSVLLDGKATWLEGYMLMTAYAIIGIMYWYLPDATDAV
eukprot:TRINITY_DN15311_c0_g2_i1.p1 TRINITY_DN15311_c0_g2~~TRINITY_DN15311_c0_g2_i1.p1  ORF type:complete len:473 (-),score=80.25 TRINITY_DN15311_c0_g2_i1:84-1448(-)